MDRLYRNELHMIPVVVMIVENYRKDRELRQLKDRQRALTQVLAPKSLSSMTESMTTQLSVDECVHLNKLLRDRLKEALTASSEPSSGHRVEDVDVNPAPRVNTEKKRERELPEVMKMFQHRSKAPK